MRSALWLAAITLISITTLTSCDDEDGDGTNYVPIDQYPSQYRDAYCTYLARCGLFPDKATCLAANLSVTVTIDPNIIGAFQNARVVYNGSNVKACLDALANQTCDETDESGRTTPSVCRDFFRGTVESGGDCYVDAECISQQCVGGSTGTTCLLGQCVGNTPPNLAPAQLNQPCTTTAGCVSGAYCDTLTDLCTSLKANGEICTQNTECGYGLACGGMTGSRTCRPLPTEGQPCPDFVCRDEGQYCDSSTASPICKKVGLPPAMCTSSTQCSQYYRCDTTLQQCVQGPTLGMSCSTTNRCFDAASFCDTTTFMCVALRNDGEMCTTDTQCKNSNCDTSTSPSVCTTPMVCF